MVRTHQVYNEYNQLTGRTWHIGTNFYTEAYTYNTQDGSLNTMTTALGDTLTHSYDGLRRLSSVMIDNDLLVYTAKQRARNFN